LAGGAVEVFFFAFCSAEDFFWAAGEVVGVVATHFGVCWWVVDAEMDRKVGGV
jgi:hypothetical protein